MGGNNGQSRNHFVELAKPTDDAIRQNRVIVTVAQQQRYSQALFEAALIVYAVPNVKHRRVGARFTKIPTLPGVWPRRGTTTTEPSG
ncbi:MAG TPA: hypothetical protein VF749_12860 [Candidatus Acidoferrum sp.]